MAKLTPEEEKELEAMLNAPTKADQRANISKTESGIRGAIQGATLGFSDEAQAAIRSIPYIGNTGDALAQIIGGSTDPAKNRFQSAWAEYTKPTDTYRNLRDQERNANAQAQQANPNTYLAGEIAGSLPQAAVGGTAMAGANTLRKAAIGAEMGAKYGAYNAAGRSNEMSDVPKDMATGAAIGGTIGGALPLAGAAATRIVKKPFEGISNYLGKSQGASNPAVKQVAQEAEQAAQSADADAKRQIAMKLQQTPEGRAVANSDSPVRNNRPGQMSQEEIGDVIQSNRDQARLVEQMRGTQSPKEYFDNKRMSMMDEGGYKAPGSSSVTESEDALFDALKRTPFNKLENILDDARMNQAGGELREVYEPVLNRNGWTWDEYNNIITEQFKKNYAAQKAQRAARK